MSLIRRLASSPRLQIFLFACVMAILTVSVPDDGRSETVELELVLAIDASASVGRAEFDLQARGLAAAFRHPEVAAAISALDGRAVMVSLVQWSSPDRQRVGVSWTRIMNASDARTMAGKIARMPRYVGSGGTAIGQAIAYAQAHLDGNGIDGRRKVIDVSGDGRANMGRMPSRSRDEVVDAGTTINGLAILNEETGVDRYYSENVIGGAGAFIMTATDYSSFQEAIRRKLVREITGAGIVRGPDVAPSRSQLGAREPQ